LYSSATLALHPIALTYFNNSGEIMHNRFDKLLRQPVIVINIGLRMFAESLEAQQVKVKQVDWVPPAGGDKELADLLDRLL
jgi:FdrA protein